MKVSIVRFLINKIKSGLGIVQDTDTATQAISKDKYVWWKGSLKKASSNIAATDTLSNSNLSDVSGGVLNEISTDLTNKINRLIIIESENPAFSNGVATVSSKSGYKLLTVHAYRNDTSYNIDAVVEKSDGNYYLYTSSKVSANISIKKYWLKV